MSSGLRTIAQTKQKRVGTGGNGNDIFLFQESDIKAACTAPGFAIVTSSLFLANSTTDLNSALSTLDNLSVPSFQAFSDLEDLGKIIRIGIMGGENNLVMFRKIRSNNSLVNGGIGGVGYVVVSNRLTNFSNKLASGITAGVV